MQKRAIRHIKSDAQRLLGSGGSKFGQKFAIDDQVAEKVVVNMVFEQGETVACFGRI